MKLLAATFAIFLVATQLGCSPTEPTGTPGDTAMSSADKAHPSPAERGLFYPLELGNRWSFVRTMTFDGEVVVTGHVERVLIGKEQQFGRWYVLEEQLISETFDGQTQETMNWIRYRQDASGLYEADISPQIPPGGVEGLSRAPVARAEVAWPGGRVYDHIELSGVGAARRAAIERSLALHRKIREAVGAGRSGPRHGGPTDNEINRLAYPLRPGLFWTIRDEPLFTSTVEEREIVSMPDGRRPAWRVRIDNEWLGPDDFVYIWVSRQGMIGFLAHIITDVVDEAGNVIGRVESEDREMLVDLDLVGVPDKYSVGPMLDPLGGLARPEANEVSGIPD